MKRLDSPTVDPASDPDAGRACSLSHSLPVVRVGAIPERETPRKWLIEGLWAASAAGLLGGAPKSCKSWLGLDMAVSVATGTPCLGAFAVKERGRSLVYLAEDAIEVVRERVASIGRHRGIDLDAIDLHVIQSQSLRLDRDDDRARLQETIRELRPKLLVLDPLVRLHGVDENNASEIAELLSSLRDIQRAFDVAVVVVHHTRKNAPVGAAASGQGLRGSGDLHAFGDSNLYLGRRRGGGGSDDRLVLTMEHRAAAAPEPVELRLVAEREDEVHLEAASRATNHGTPGSESPEARILDVLDVDVETERDAIRRKASVRNETLGIALKNLEATGRIVRGTTGWRRSAARIPDSAS